MPKSSSKSPSLMRYSRVQQVLETEPAFVAKMSARSQIVCRPNGEQQKFSPETISVTQTIHESGKDAHKVHKTEIIRIACQVFGIGRPQTAAPATNATNGAVAHVEAAPKPPVESPPHLPETPRPKPAPKQAKVAPKSKPAVKPKPVKQQAAPPSAPPSEPQKQKEEPPKPAMAPAAAVAEDSRATILAKARDALTDRPGESAAFNAYISVYSLTLTALQLIEIYDNQPGKDKRIKTLDELAKEVNKFTSIKSVKETQKAQS